MHMLNHVACTISDISCIQYYLMEERGSEFRCGERRDRLFHMSHGLCSLLALFKRKQRKGHAILLAAFFELLFAEIARIHDGDYNHYTRIFVCSLFDVMGVFHAKYPSSTLYFLENEFVSNAFGARLALRFSEYVQGHSVDKALQLTTSNAHNHTMYTYYNSMRAKRRSNLREVLQQQISHATHDHIFLVFDKTVSYFRDLLHVLSCVAPLWHACIEENAGGMHVAFEDERDEVTRLHALHDFDFMDATLHCAGSHCPRLVSHVTTFLARRRRHLYFTLRPFVLLATLGTLPGSVSTIFRHLSNTVRRCEFIENVLSDFEQASKNFKKQQRGVQI